MIAIRYCGEFFLYIYCLLVVVIYMAIVMYHFCELQRIGTGKLKNFVHGWSDFNTTLVYRM